MISSKVVAYGHDDSRTGLRIRMDRWMDEDAQMLTNIDLTFFSERTISNAFLTASAVAPPPTSRKLAGSPPLSLRTSMVAMARPAPLTRQPMFPSSLMKLSPLRKRRGNKRQGGETNESTSSFSNSTQHRSNRSLSCPLPTFLLSTLFPAPPVLSRPFPLIPQEHTASPPQTPFPFFPIHAQHLQKRRKESNSLLRSVDLSLVLLRDIPQRKDVLLPELGVVVKAKLSVHAEDRAVLELAHRVDLDLGRVLRLEDGVEVLEDLGGLLSAAGQLEQGSDGKKGGGCGGKG
jgi:hypothetical protein